MCMNIKIDLKLKIKVGVIKTDGLTKHVYFYIHAPTFFYGGDYEIYIYN